MRRRELILAAFAGLLPAFSMAQDAPPPVPAPAATPVVEETRAAVHPGFARLVFAGANGQPAIGLTASADGSTLTVHFQSPVAPPLDPIRRALGPYLSDVVLSADGTTLTAKLTRPVDVKPTRMDAQTEVIDLVDRPAPPAAADAAAKPPPAADAAVPKPVAAAAVPPPTPIHPPTPVPAKAAPAPVPAVPAPSQNAATPAPDTTAVAAQNDASAAQDDTNTPEPPITGTLGHAAGNSLQIRYTLLDDGVSLRFEWQRPTAAAVFRRDNAVWIVFDQGEKLDFGDFQAANWSVVTSIAQLPSRSGTVLRLNTWSGFYPAVRRAGTAWIVDFRGQPQHPPAPVVPSVHLDGVNAALDYKVMDPAGPISMVDPDAGDVLVAVPLPQLGQGVDASADYPDFGVIGSAQGLVFRPLTDQLTIRQLDGEIEVSAPGGLALSPDADRTLAPRAQASNNALLNLTDWQGPQDNFIGHRQSLMAAIIAASDDGRAAARLDLAKFYLGNGMAAEALGVIRTIEREAPDQPDDPVMRAMQGAAEEMMGQYDAAATDLGNSGLDSHADIAIWRAALAVDQGKWEDAAALAPKGKDALETYPPVFRRKLDLALAEALFRAGNKDDADALTADVLASDPTQGQRDYATVLQGRSAAERGDVGKAMTLWQQAADSPKMDLGRAQGAYAIAITKYEKGEVSLADTIAAVDRLRYAWRGDEFEILVLRKLADLYLADGDYRSEFQTLQRIPLAFPDTPSARDATEKMQASFSDMFLGDTADKMPPLKALAIYEEFKELTPAGAQGDAIIRKLADRLVSVDLLDRAGALLENQVKTRLTGIDQARVAAQLALVRLLDHRPQDSLNALDLPVQGSLPQDLARQRAELRGHALAELGKTDDALKILEGDDSADADRLRADIYAKAANWPQLVSLLQKDLKPPAVDGTIDPDTASTVLRIATAMVLGKDRTGLDTLQKRYGTAMDQGPYKDAFRVVAGSSGADTTTFRTLADRVAQISDLQSFMSNYRQRVQQDKLSTIN